MRCRSRAADRIHLLFENSGMGPQRESGGERESRSGAQAGQYLPIRREWKSGDSVTISMPLTTELLAANPRVAENTGRVAIQRGPIVYCMEESDQASGTEAADVSIALGGKQKDFQVEHMPEMLDGVTVLRHEAAIAEVPSAERALYAPADQQ